MNTQIFKQAQSLVAENSAALLTGTGVVGVVTTAVLTGRASVKAHEVVAKHERHSYELEFNPEPESDENFIVRKEMYTLDTLDKVKMTWPLFIPPVASGVTTMSAIIFSYRISVSKSAALAAAYGISEKAFAEYKTKVLEHVTPKKADDIRDSVAQQQMVDNPVPKAFIVGDGEVMCLDAFSGRYFRSTVEDIRKAENDINADIGQHNVASLGDFYEKIGLKQTDISEDFVWNLHNHCEIEYTTQLTDDGRPCLVVQFVNAPRPAFDPSNRDYT